MQSFRYKYLGNNVYKEIYPNNECNGIANISLKNNTLSFSILDNSECDLNKEQGIVLDPIVVVSPQPSTTLVSPSLSIPSVDGGTGGGCSMTKTTNLSALSYLVSIILLIILKRIRSIKSFKNFNKKD